jgi:signal transduction histidine kinase
MLRTLVLAAILVLLALLGKRGDSAAWAQSSCPEELSAFDYRNYPGYPEKYQAFRMAYSQRQLSESVRLGAELITAATELEDYELLACMYPKLNALYAAQEKLEQAINCALSYQALPSSYLDSVELIKQQSFLSEAYSRIDLWEEAYRYHLEAQRNAATQRDPKLRAMVAYRAGSVHFGQGKRAEALAYYEEALIYSQQAGATNKLNQIYGALTATALGLQDTAQARNWNTSQLATASTPAEKAQAAQYQGNIALLTGDTTAAQQHFTTALELFESNEQHLSAAEARYSIADVLWQLGQTTEATEYLLEISSSTRVPYYPWVAKADKRLATYYEARGSYRKAFSHSQRMNAKLEEKVASAPGENELEALKVKHLLARKEAELRASELQSQLYAVALIAVLVILSMLTLAFWTSRRAHHTTSRQKEQIEAQNRQLIAYNERLENFNRVVSHDLKQPLRTASSLLTLIRRRHATKLSDTGQSDFQLAEQAVARGHNLVEALLQLTKLERLNPDEFSWVRSSEPLQQARDQLQQTLLDTQAQLTVAPPLETWPEMYALTSYLTQTWQNLIANACKFTRPGEAPTIHIAYHADKYHHRFTIADRGIGAPPVTETDIFTMFTRSAAHREYHGSGIGLATCKRIVELHGGRIGYYANGTQGTVFFFTIPKKPHHQPVPPPGESADHLGATV